MKTTYLLIVFLSGYLVQSCKPESRIIWQIGETNNSFSEFALSPNKYGQYIDVDFGWEDRYFLIGTSDEKND